MESNLLLEQYSWYKKQQLAKSPFKCLLNADIEPNPHQVNAFCAAIQALKTGGIILADEVGLGKTIEAGLVLNYVLDNGAKKVLISLPATLRKQWEVELLEKFGRQAVILDRYTVEHDLANVQTHLGNADEVSIVIASYDYSSKLIKRFPHVKWDFLIIDEAHNLRNVFHGTKRAKNLYDLTHGIPKILLTATPLQNSLTDLHGLVSFIDPRIFGSEKVFNRRFVDGCDYEELKQELLPVLYRTLRRDVGKYMAFSKRTCITVDFHLSAEEKELYDVTNDFLRRDSLYSIPNANRGLIILVIRKLLASSSFALIETFEVLEKRLEKLYEGTKSAYAQEGFDLFWGFVEDEIDEEGFNEYDDEETAEKKQAIQAELKIVRHILEMARAIKTNAKIIALREALKSAFDHQISEELNQKALVNYPAVVISANEDVKAVAPEVIRRTVICRVQAGLTNTEVMSSNIVRTVQREVGTALYREYLRQMLEIVPELLELMKDDEQDEAPDILKASSQVLMDIFKEYGPETLPEYIRVLSLEDYFSEKVTGSYAIKTIQNAWKTSKDSFEIYPRTNELCYNAGATYEADRILKELPETLEVRKSRDCLMMNLEEAQKFFGITFKKPLFPWLSKIFA